MKSSTKTIVIATANPGKLKEFQKIMGEDFHFLTLKDIGFTEDIIEDGLSFAANAEIKARAVQKATQWPVLADDSGLEVNALGGAPGIYSARYAGEHGNDTANNQKLLKELSAKEDRSARFACALCYMSSEQEAIIFHGYCKGNILDKPRGKEGFGYDPLFQPDNYERSFGEMSHDEKKALSHRGEAIKAFYKWFSHQEYA
jgi:XTP/dITP diphosphohydrolase